MVRRDQMDARESEVRLERMEFLEQEELMELQ